tara:strand:+ start:90 stop:389 length:300 start_codon:yes stop_codon:yes gene_type:complete
MKPYWTSKQAINGLFHFVIVNEYEDNGEIYFLLVSAIDVEVNINIAKRSFENSEQWICDWNCSKEFMLITDEYKEFKLRGKNKKNKRIFIDKNSEFNIS